MHATCNADERGRRIRYYTYCTVPNNSRGITPFEILHFRIGKPFSFPYPGL